MNHPHLLLCHVNANNTACVTHKSAESITVPSTATAKVKDTASFHRLRYHCTTSIIPDGIEGASAKMLPDWVHRKVLTTHLCDDRTPVQVARWVVENREGKLCAVGWFIWLVFPCTQGDSYHTWSWFCCPSVSGQTASAVSVRQILTSTALATINATFWWGGAYAEGCDSGRSEAYFRTWKHKMVQCKFFKRTSVYFWCTEFLFNHRIQKLYCLWIT